MTNPPPTPRVVRRQVQRETVEQWKTSDGRTSKFEREAKQWQFWQDWEESAMPGDGVRVTWDGNDQSLCGFIADREDLFAAFFAAGSDPAPDSAPCAGQGEDVEAIKAERDALKAEVERLREELSNIADSVVGYAEGFPESTPNGAGSLVSTEPSLNELVTFSLNKLESERDALKAEVERLEADQKACNRDYSDLRDRHDALAARVRELEEQVDVAQGALLTMCKSVARLEARERQLLATVRGFMASLTKDYERWGHYFFAPGGWRAGVQLKKHNPAIGGLGKYPDTDHGLFPDPENLPAAAVDLLLGDAGKTLDEGKDANDGD